MEAGGRLEGDRAGAWLGRGWRETRYKGTWTERLDGGWREARENGERVKESGGRPDRGAWRQKFTGLSVRVLFNKETGQQLISGMGELHMETIKHRILNHYKAKAVMGELYIAYRYFFSWIFGVSIILFFTIIRIFSETNAEIEGDCSFRSLVFFFRL
jgi:hypothetical protein